VKSAGPSRGRGACRRRVRLRSGARALWPALPVDASPLVSGRAGAKKKKKKHAWKNCHYVLSPAPVGCVGLS
jgi:hypothetical protein